MPSSSRYSRVPTADDVQPFTTGDSSTSYPPPPRNRSCLSPPTHSSSDLPYSRTYTTNLKGKRKGKATDDFFRDEEDDETSRVSSTPKGLNFCVRFTDGTTEDIVDMYVTERETVRDVKKRLRMIRPNSLQDEEQRPRRLRLIQLGRMLVDGVFLVPYTLQLASNRKKLEQATNEREGIVEKVGSFVKDAVGRDGAEDEESRLEKGELFDRKGKGKEKESNGTEQAEEQIWLHCSIGDVIEDEEVTNELPSVDQQTTPLEGFDRLREAGFSDEEIENMRAEFRERRGVQADEDDAEHQRALEEQWLSGMTGTEEALGDMTGTGHYVALLKGVCVGFFMPFLPLFFFRTQIFSRRMQMAIVLGILINLAYGLLRLLG
ncbi:Dsc3p [Sporobolomyces salmoneus]|uniref:Dsc3p n=1 Tax=Sporobolomyces salmoneus TaxID=183962 RepID=UPI003177AD3F